MRANQRRLLASAGFIGLCVLACNFPSASVATPDTHGTGAADTWAAFETGDAMTQTAAYLASTPTPAGTTTATNTRGSSNPVVTKDSLCWVGPGSQYEVVSAIRSGTNIELLGRGTISGWYIVRNPIYRDPCWIMANALQIPPGLNVSGLPYFSPPATPTPTPTDTPENTATTTPSPTNTP